MSSTTQDQTSKMLAVLESLYGCAERTVTVGQLPAAEHGQEVWTPERRVWQDTEAPDHTQLYVSRQIINAWMNESNYL